MVKVFYLLLELFIFEVLFKRILLPFAAHQCLLKGQVLKSYNCIVIVIANKSAAAGGFSLTWGLFYFERNMYVLFSKVKDVKKYDIEKDLTLFCIFI